MPNPRQQFLELVSSLKPALVLEVGTLQSVPGRSTHVMSWFPHVKKPQYTMVDIAAGADVDVVANIHALPREWTSFFDVFVASAVFEHLQRPWIAAQEIERILSPGGICYISTHQTFPIHGYPQDYFRFTKEALTLLFSDAGLEVIDAAYEFRCKILAPAEAVPPAYLEEWNETFPSFCNVHLVARKGMTAPPATR